MENKESREIVDQLIGHRLQQADIKKILNTLSNADRNELLEEISSIMGKLSALIHISNQVSDTLSLNELLQRIVPITTEVTLSERGTLFLHDAERRELFSKVMSGDLVEEIRIADNVGIAGTVFTTGEAIIIQDAYADSRFNKAVDLKTGFRTRNILCAPIKTRDGRRIGVVQLLNKKSGNFNLEDQALLQAVTSQVSAALVNGQLYEEICRVRTNEKLMLEVTDAISSQLYLEPLLQKIMEVTSELLDAQRSTLFLNDKHTNELWSMVAQGSTSSIRFPNHLGIAGSVFTSGQVVNIPDAYADPRFNKEFDRKTGFKTDTILCMPIRNKKQETLGVIQVLNKNGGPFTVSDESRLKVFCSQASIAIENAVLFENVENMRSYNESMFGSMSNGVLTLDQHNHVVRCNKAFEELFKVKEADIAGSTATDFFSDTNAWVLAPMDGVLTSRKPDITMDQEFKSPTGEVISVNLTIVPLTGTKQEKLGLMLIFEDISTEKRVKSTMSRYVAKEVMDQLLNSGANALGGKTLDVAVLFSDIRSFTSISEESGAEATVLMLNDYFTLMVDEILANHGILDKYIGDAIMAVFGTPFTSGEDSDRAVRAGIGMLRQLQEFNRKRAEEKKRPIDIGIGINTDRVVSGNIGSPKRMEYTVIGDGVNLASRVEGVTKYYGARLIITEFTFRKLKDKYQHREIDRIRVKGKDEPVGIYEILQYHTPETFPNMQNVLECFEKGKAHYNKQEFEKGIQHFAKALGIFPADKVPKHYIERCQYFIENPPAKDWDGVWTMTEK